MRYFYLLLIVCCLFSCVSHKNLVYLRGNKDRQIDSLDKSTIPYKIQVGDILDIKVSSIDPLSVAIFNKDVGGSNPSQVNPATIFMNGYTVSDSGSINFPIVGKISVTGMTVTEIRTEIENRLKDYYKYASLDVKLMSFRVSMLGEVNSQGYYYIYSDQANILQLIGMAGGITDFGNKQKVKIVRKSGDNSYKVAYVNLEKSDIINSEFFYLQPNDVIYIEPLKAKAFKINSTAIQLTLSIITLLLVIVNLAARK